MLIYDNEYETKENKNRTKDKIKLQHLYMYCRRGIHVVSRDFIDHHSNGSIYENGRHSLSTEDYW